MRRCSIKSIALAIVLSGALGAGALDAKTLRYAYRSDANSLDPYALNETFTHSFLSNIYEPLIERDKDLSLIPALATKWEPINDKTWRFTLREGVKFHNGNPFTAHDVEFSFKRALGEGSDVTNKIGTVERVEVVNDHVIDFHMKTVNPILPSEITTWFIMDKEWAEANNATTPSSVKGATENYASQNANGTGAFKVKSRTQDVKTVLVPNPDWWGKKEHNLTEVVFTPIKSDPTRVAALLSGRLDMIYPVPLQDVDRIKGQNDLEMLQGPETRTIYLGVDQHRDELLESNVKGKNPFKDRRVRLAFYKAIDINLIRDKVMRGASTPTALMVAPGINGFDPKLNERYPYDVAAAKKLLKEAGYPDGFEVGMDCPNNRYVNDEKICQAVVSMLAKIGVKVNLLAQPKSKYFKKILSFNTSFYLLAWAPSTFDSLSPLFSVMSTPERYAKDKSKVLKGEGAYNPAGYSNPKLDELTRKVRVEIDQKKRNALISKAFAIHKEDIGHLPLHQQALAWGVRKGVDVTQRADNGFALRWVRMP